MPNLPRGTRFRRWWGPGTLKADRAGVHGKTRALIWEILVTRVRGHTVVVVRAPAHPAVRGAGETVRRMQTLLLRADPASLQVYG